MEVPRVPASPGQCPLPAPRVAPSACECPQSQGGSPSPFLGESAAGPPQGMEHLLSRWAAALGVPAVPSAAVAPGGSRGQEGTAPEPALSLAAHPGGQEADLGGHEQHRAVPAGGPLLHRGHGRPQQLPAVSGGAALGAFLGCFGADFGVFWGCFGDVFGVHWGFELRILAPRGTQGFVWGVLGAGQGEAGLRSGRQCAPSAIPSAAGVPSKNQCLGRSGGLCQQEWLWCVAVSECSTEGLSSSGEAKGRAPAELWWMQSL